MQVDGRAEEVHPSATAGKLLQQPLASPRRPEELDANAALRRHVEQAGATERKRLTVAHDEALDAERLPGNGKVQLRSTACRRDRACSP